MQLIPWAKKYERIYCFPNSLGWLGFGLFIVIILAGATYQNNLVFIMGFLLLSVGLIAILQTARTIRNIEIISIRIKGNFPNDMGLAEIVIYNPSDELKLNFHLYSKWKGGVIEVQVPELGPKTTAIVKTQFALRGKRGFYPIGKMRILSTYPYGLFRAWKYRQVQAEVPVYPDPQGRPLDLLGKKSASEDFSKHKPYESGDPLSRIDWKVFFRRQQMFVREFQDSQQQNIMLRFKDTSADGLEAKLSQLSLWVLQAQKHGIHFGLELPKVHINIAQSEVHFDKCMTELAKIE